ncbi:hypothetical protein EDB84DRAFT_1160489 [Lactarius hengduanensis]|nr:hypothetical protein EDB84DRAFT_1160489 [Lactarius hengduanensis]
MNSVQSPPPPPAGPVGAGNTSPHRKHSCHAHLSETTSVSSPLTPTLAISSGTDGFSDPIRHHPPLQPRSAMGPTSLKRIVARTHIYAFPTRSDHRHQDHGKVRCERGDGGRRVVQRRGGYVPESMRPMCLSLVWEWTISSRYLQSSTSHTARSKQDVLRHKKVVEVSQVFNESKNESHKLARSIPKPTLRTAMGVGSGSSFTRTRVRCGCECECTIDGHYGE